MPPKLTIAASPPAAPSPRLDTPTPVSPWIDHRTRAALTAFAAGEPLPAGCAATLRLAADEHGRALAPANLARCTRILARLRLATIARDESEQEARASFEILREDLDDVPADILEAACRAYRNHPGRRFFPRSAGELRAFINPDLSQRRAHAAYLEMLADRAAREERAPAPRREDDAHACPPRPIGADMLAGMNAVAARCGFAWRWNADGTTSPHEPGLSSPNHAEDAQR